MEAVKDQPRRDQRKKKKPSSTLHCGNVKNVMVGNNTLTYTVADRETDCCVNASGNGGKVRSDSPVNHEVCTRKNEVQQLETLISNSKPSCSPTELQQCQRKRSETAEQQVLGHANSTELPTPNARGDSTRDVHLKQDIQSVNTNVTTLNKKLRLHSENTTTTRHEDVCSSSIADDEETGKDNDEKEKELSMKMKDQIEPEVIEVSLLPNLDPLKSYSTKCCSSSDIHQCGRSSPDITDQKPRENAIPVDYKTLNTKENKNATSDSEIYVKSVDTSQVCVLKETCSVSSVVCQNPTDSDCEYLIHPTPSTDAENDVGDLSNDGQDNHMPSVTQIVQELVAVISPSVGSVPSSQVQQIPERNSKNPVETFQDGDDVEDERDNNNEETVSENDSDESEMTVHMIGENTLNIKLHDILRSHSLDEDTTVRLRYRRISKPTGARGLKHSGSLEIHMTIDPYPEAEAAAIEAFRNNENFCSRLQRVFSNLMAPITGIRNGSIVLELRPKSKESVQRIYEAINDGSFDKIILDILKEQSVFKLIKGKDVTVDIELDVPDDIVPDSSRDLKSDKDHEVCGITIRVKDRNRDEMETYVIAGDYGVKSRSGIRLQIPKQPFIMSTSSGYSTDPSEEASARNPDVARELLRCIVNEIEKESKLKKDVVVYLRKIAEELDAKQRKMSKAKISFASTGIVGSALTMAGLVALPFTFGASVSLMAAGIAVGVSSGVGGVATDIADSILNKKTLKEAQAKVDQYYETVRKLIDKLTEMQDINCDQFQSLISEELAELDEDLLNAVQSILAGVLQEKNPRQTAITGVAVGAAVTGVAVAAAVTGVVTDVAIGAVPAVANVAAGAASGVAFGAASGVAVGATGAAAVGRTMLQTFEAGLKAMKIGGVVVAAVTVPLDIYTMVSHSIKLQKNTPSATAEEIRKLAEHIEKYKLVLSEEGEGRPLLKETQKKPEKEGKCL